MDLITWLILDPTAEAALLDWIPHRPTKTKQPTDYAARRDELWAFG